MIPVPAISEFLKWLKWLQELLNRRKKPKISILIPFSSKDPVRIAHFKWLLKYWKYELPDAEVIIGISKSKVFCKGEALNNAAKQSRGKVLVIMDADAYIPGEVIDRCADKILEELDNHLWLIPYRHLYRLRKDITELIIESDPANPLRIPQHPPKELTENNRDISKYGHRFGAMCQMFPREAYNVLGCFDERFQGWGGEDIALVRALDTLWGKHKTTKNDILHLWHPYIGWDYNSRRWPGQKSAGGNSELANAYNRATRHPSKMRRLVDEGCKFKRR